MTASTSPSSPRSAELVATRLRQASRLNRLGRWLIILPPLVFLVVFFLVPFAFAFKISFAQTAVHIPPFSDLLSHSRDGVVGLSINLGNYAYLFTDDVYAISYLYSIKTAFFSTIACLLLGYPMAYAIARASKANQNILLLIIILPFTSVDVAGLAPAARSVQRASR